MKIENNLPFKLLFKQKRSELGLSQKDVAEKTNTSPTLISKYEKGLSKPRIETARRIAEVLNIDLDTLIKSLDQDDTYLIKIPFYLDDTNNVETEYFYIPSNLFTNINTDNLIAYHYRGGAMSPLFKDGDILLIDKAQKDIEEQDSAFLTLYRETYDSIKHITYNEFANEYILYCKNELYAPIYSSQEELDIIGRVIWYSRFI